jgi:hypothetical protein
MGTAFDFTTLFVFTFFTTFSIISCFTTAGLTNYSLTSRSASASLFRHLSASFATPVISLYRTKTIRHCSRLSSLEILEAIFGALPNSHALCMMLTNLGLYFTFFRKKELFSRT